MTNLTYAEAVKRVQGMVSAAAPMTRLRWLVLAFAAGWWFGGRAGRP